MSIFLQQYFLLCTGGTFFSLILKLSTLVLLKVAFYSAASYLYWNIFRYLHICTVSMGKCSFITCANKLRGSFPCFILGWFFSSAKDNINVEESSRFLVQKIIDNDKWSAHGARMKETSAGASLRLHNNGSNKNAGTSLDPPKGKCSCWTKILFFIIICGVCSMQFFQINY